MTKINFGIGKLVNNSRDSFVGVGKTAVKGVQDIIAQSSRAVCATFEREVNVPADKVATTKARLRNKGFFIVGTSEPGTRSRKIWFIRGGLAGI